MSDLDQLALVISEEVQRWLDAQRIMQLEPCDALAELDAGVRLYRQLGAQAKALKDTQDAIKSRVVVLLGMQGVTSFTNDFGTASLRSGYPKVSYDAKALDILCRDDAELKARLAPYRSVTNVPGYLDIR